MNGIHDLETSEKPCTLCGTLPYECTYADMKEREHNGGFSEEESRREEIARDALDAGFPGDEDPYWLCNLFGRCKYGDLLTNAKELREDANTLETAFAKIENGELTPAEAALFIAERINLGDYDTYDHLYDQLPIEVELPEEGDSDD